MKSIIYNAKTNEVTMIDVPDEENTTPETIAEPTLEERLAALEFALLAMMEEM